MQTQPFTVEYYDDVTHRNDSMEIIATDINSARNVFNYSSLNKNLKVIRVYNTKFKERFK